MVFSAFDKGFILAALVIIGISFIFVHYPGTAIIKTDQVKKFASCDELKSFIKSSETPYYGGGLDIATGAMRTESATQQAVGGEGAPKTEGGSTDYSATNIQVEGVDEADIVKNDGKYIYTVSGNKVVIVDAYPAENAKILSEIELNGTASNIFINGNKLVVFGSEGGYGGPYYKTMYYYPYSQNSFIKVYDVSDRSNPILKRDLSVNGSYYDSRMIGDYVYVIMNQPIYMGGEITVPMIASGGEAKSVCNCPDVYYFDVPDYSKRFTTIMAVNTNNDEEEPTGEVYVMGTTQNIYVSLNNIYVTYTKWLSEYDFIDRIVNEALLPLVPLDVKVRLNEIMGYNISSSSKMQEISSVVQNYINSLSDEERKDLETNIQEKMVVIQEEISKEMEKTIIHKISINNGKVEYKAQGSVAGNALNQFSMDEYTGYFRIATTTSASGSANSMNHVYVLDGDLNVVGKLEDLAKGERIYSARFIGNKGYMVTFRQIDPLYVIDLSDPANPKVLGYLKIPGVSDYLHPYDENHVIGLGRDATEEGRMQGMKLSLFDVTDVQNPTEVSKYMIGDRGTSSEALNDHKAFLFSKEKNLLVIPVSLVEGDKWNAWNGAYVFSLDLENGFVLKGKVTHSNQTENETEYYSDYQSQIRRSLYMDDILYTISQKMIKMNTLTDMAEINNVSLPYEETVYPILYEEGVVRGI